MYRKARIAFYSIALICSKVNAGIETNVLEWGGTGGPDICNHIFSTTTTNDILMFFQLAQPSKAEYDYNSDCQIEGVLQDRNATLHSFAINGNGIGFIRQNNHDSIFQCFSGTKCCEVLPHFCPAKE